MQVKELSNQTGITCDAIRYYTRIGLLKPSRSESNGYNLYNKTDLVHLKFISCAKDLGFSLHEISDILNHAHHNTSPCPLVRETLANRIQDNRKKLDELIQLQTRMETALLKWNDMPDKLPDGHSVCHLIESAGE